MDIRFSEYRPSSLLAQYIQTYWTGDFNLYSENKFLQSVVPNGCVELIIHLTSDHCELVKEESWSNTPEFTLIGLQTKPYEVRFNQLVQVFGIRFHPEGLHAIFGVPPAKFMATFENSQYVLGSDFTDYCSRLRESITLEKKIALTEGFLTKKISKRFTGYDYVKLASRIIRKNRGMISVKELMEQIPISPRQLQRTFKARFGITAKEYMRLSRLNAIQQYMLNTEDLNLTRLSYENGFADQSHFIKEFRLLTGINPRGFLKQQSNFIANPADR